MSVVVIIPARYASTRLPGKALADIAGKPMVVRVLERAQQARGVERVLVATDDARIVRAVADAGGTAVMTRSDHPSGTDRLAEVAATLHDDVVINVQGDLPLLDPSYVEAVLRALTDPVPEDAPKPVMGTLATPLLPGEEARSQVVKVVCDLAGNALYFSRHPIPHGEGEGLRHIGIYAYRRDFLLRLAALSPTPLERSERLEQLRVLEHGYRIRAARVEADESMIEVDTPEDLQRVRGRLEGRPTATPAVRGRDG